LIGGDLEPNPENLVNPVKGDVMAKAFILICAVLIFSCEVAGQSPTPSPDCGEMKARLDRAETRLNDWPALARYRDDNNKIAAPAKNEQRVVFMGDSITDFSRASLTSIAVSAAKRRRRCSFVFVAT
jgi:hypothetical protein